MPFAMSAEHTSNIFCMGFDSTNKKLFSAGNDELIMIHEASTGQNVHTIFHADAIFGLSIDPFNDNIVATACSDGGAFIFDLRQAAYTHQDSIMTIRSHRAFHGIMHNPVESRLLTTANTREGVGLWDTRKINEPVIRYTDSANDLQSAMSVRFNIRGTQILALRRRHSAILYNLSSHFPIAEFDDSTYYNSCTMKSCCFAGDDDQYILSGSDDFKIYVWKIPQEMMDSQFKTPKEPIFINKAHMRLSGHRSIANQVRYNYTNSMIASSGVEKIIKLWSCFPLPGSEGSLDDSDVISGLKGSREVFSHEDYITLVLNSGQLMSHDYSHQSTSEDPRMMAFFDSLVQRDIEGWTSDSSTDSTDGYTLMSIRSNSSSETSDSDAVESVLNTQTESYITSLMNRIEDVMQKHKEKNDPSMVGNNDQSSTIALALDQNSAEASVSAVTSEPCATSSSSQTNNNNSEKNKKCEGSTIVTGLKRRRVEEKRSENNDDDDDDTDDTDDDDGPSKQPYNSENSNVDTQTVAAPNSSLISKLIRKEQCEKIVNLISDKKIEQLKKTARVVIRSTRKRLKKVKKHCMLPEGKNSAHSTRSISKVMAEKESRYNNLSKLTELLTEKLEQNSTKVVHRCKQGLASRRRLRRLATQSDNILNDLYPESSDSDNDIPVHLLRANLNEVDRLQYGDNSDSSSSGGWVTSDADDETLSSDDDSRSSRENNLITFGNPDEGASSSATEDKTVQVSRCPKNGSYDRHKISVATSSATPLDNSEEKETSNGVKTNELFDPLHLPGPSCSSHGQEKTTSNGQTITSQSTQASNKNGDRSD